MSDTTTRNQPKRSLLRELVGDDFFNQVVDYEQDCRTANVAAFAGAPIDAENTSRS